jgi:hypothetical protein
MMSGELAIRRRTQSAVERAELGPVCFRRDPFDLDAVQPQEPAQLAGGHLALRRDLSHPLQQPLTPVLRLAGRELLQFQPRLLVVTDHELSPA